ncbi:membrane protein insertion efficiency factor YidD [Acetivibrio cellulolyticus]|uniref:membrane protein insertion efficiency factor YidD n=1 Tax=Acetivibrio cellulolyticus TaxID=35830 RepID=UPI0001E2EBB3|nr:membrane protein insertion efficiency factor YidD [Acetivibrio cellulolyticus]
MIGKLVILLIRFYQKFISPFKSVSSCRFYPTCSQYAIDAISKYGIIRGSVKSLKRLLKCHPFHPGGYDPVK